MADDVGRGCSDRCGCAGGRFLAFGSHQKIPNIGGFYLWGKRENKKPGREGGRVVESLGSDQGPRWARVPLALPIMPPAPELGGTP